MNHLNLRGSFLMRSESFICLDGTCSFKVYWDKYLATAVSNID